MRFILKPSVPDGGRIAYMDTKGRDPMRFAKFVVSGFIPRRGSRLSGPLSATLTSMENRATVRINEG